MGVLDFVKNRGQAVSAPANDQGGPGPETAKQMYTRQAAEEKTNAKSPDRGMTSEQRSVIADVQGKMGAQSEQPEPTATPAPSPAPAGADNPQPMQQQGVAADKTAPEMSPTSGLASSRAKDVEGPSSPAPTPDKSKQQTMARSSQSWER